MESSYLPEASQRRHQATPINSFSAVSNAPLRSLSEQDPTELPPPVDRHVAAKTSDRKTEANSQTDTAYGHTPPATNAERIILKSPPDVHHEGTRNLVTGSSPPQHAALPSDLLIRWSCSCICTSFHASPLAKRLNGPRCKNLRW